MHGWHGCQRTPSTSLACLTSEEARACKVDKNLSPSFPLTSAFKRPYPIAPGSNVEEDS